MRYKLTRPKIAFWRYIRDVKESFQFITLFENFYGKTRFVPENSAVSYDTLSIGYLPDKDVLNLSIG